MRRLGAQWILPALGGVLLILVLFGFVGPLTFGSAAPNQSSVTMDAASWHTDSIPAVGYNTGLNLTSVDPVNGELLVFDAIYEKPNAATLPPSVSAQLIANLPGPTPGSHIGLFVPLNIRDNSTTPPAVNAIFHQLGFSNPGGVHVSGFATVYSSGTYQIVISEYPGLAGYVSLFFYALNLHGASFSPSQARVQTASQSGSPGVRSSNPSVAAQTSMVGQQILFLDSVYTVAVSCNVAGCAYPPSSLFMAQQPLTSPLLPPVYVNDINTGFGSTDFFCNGIGFALVSPPSATLSWSGCPETGWVSYVDPLTLSSTTTNSPAGLSFPGLSWILLGSGSVLLVSPAFTLTKRRSSTVGN